MIGMDGKREPRKSVLSARLDDYGEDDDIYTVGRNKYSYTYKLLIFCTLTNE